MSCMNLCINGPVWWACLFPIRSRRNEAILLIMREIVGDDDAYCYGQWQVKQMRFKKPRVLLLQAALAVFFLLSFSILKYVPGLAMTKEVWIVAIFIFLFTFYVADRLVKGLQITQLEGYILLMLVWVPISSSVQSHREFGQPMLYGLLAQRNIVLAASAIILLYLLRHNRITLPDVEQALVKLAWACLAVFTLLTLVVDPSQFADSGVGFVGGVNTEKAIFKFNDTCIVFGLFYYIFKGFWGRNTKQILLATPFLLYLILVAGGRSLLLSVFAASIFFLYRWSAFNRLLMIVPKLLLFTTVLFAVIWGAKQDYLIDLTSRFGDAFTVALTFKETSDASANARINETANAIPYIEKHWAFGNGDLSHQWQDGFESWFGYFYPSDIGVIGAVFLFGIIGVLLFCCQFLFAVRYANRLPKNGGKHGALVSAIKGFLLYYAIHSLVTGLFVHSMEIGLLFIAILYWATLTEKNTNSVVSN